MVFLPNSPHVAWEVAPSTQALALGGPAPSKPRVGSRMWYNLPLLGMKLGTLVVGFNTDWDWETILVNGGQNYGKKTSGLMETTHYFDWAIFNSNVKLPEASVLQ